MKLNWVRLLTLLTQLEKKNQNSIKLYCLTLAYDETAKRQKTNSGLSGNVSHMYFTKVCPKIINLQLNL